jgi:hypothetical protein
MKGMSGQLFMFVAGAQLKLISLTDELKADSPDTPYGGGTYGQGAYPGSNYQIYLPIINKEEN